MPAGATAKRLRIWPGIVVLVVQWLLMTVPHWLAPGTMVGGMIARFGGPLFGMLGVIIWWLFLSRLRWRDRFLGLGACAILAACAYPFYHATFDGMVVVMFVFPALTTAWVLWFVFTPYLSWPVRRAGLICIMALVWAHFALVRFDGVTGGFTPALAYRWMPTAEDSFLAEHGTQIQDTDQSQAAPAAPLALGPGDWPGFRGPNRDSRLVGVQIATSWAKHPPKEIWKHRIGPGWSSFAVVGTRLFTQEQWAQDEAVVCYDANTGKILWSHTDPARFSEKLGGDGPRATPSFHDGKIFALGATGRLNCLDAMTGRPHWSRDIVADSSAPVPMWGFSASPLVAQGVVTVFAGGPDGKSVLGYHVSSGNLAWSANAGKVSYCSLQPARLGGLEQLLVTNEDGLTAFDPVSGKVLWLHSVPGGGMVRVVQPAILSNTDVLLGAGMDPGTVRVKVGQAGNAWTTQEVWASRAIKPYFNDFVVHGEHLYGFDGEFFTCVSLDRGKKQWRERGFESGQVLLLADQGLLIIQAEDGKVALVEAKPEAFKELGRFDAITGKTWNHPVVAHGKLFVRNAEWAACYDLTGNP
jgi:outer membrane protein assembly factor BamB